MKKGISLIVLVITIIVMIILAAAIIISISNSNIINKANKAVADTNIATIKEAVALKFADVTLAIKEAGNDSILGGKTVGQYIEQELINDGTMKESDAVIFTPKGGVYGPTEYNSIPDKDETRDWRYINGKLYYVGTDISKRKALKENPNVNTDYMYIYSDMMIKPDSESWNLICKLSNIGYLGKVNSFNKLFYTNINGNTDLNAAINSSSVGLTDDVALSTGMELTLKETYNEQQIKVKVIMYSDSEGDGYSSNDDMFTAVSVIDAMTLGAEYGWPIEDYYTYIGENGTMSISFEEFLFFFSLAYDGDMNNNINKEDYWLSNFLYFAVSSKEAYQNKSISEMKGYLFYKNSNTEGTRQEMEILNNNLNIYKKVKGFPADIAK